METMMAKPNALRAKPADANLPTWRDELGMIAAPARLCAGVLGAAVLLVGAATWYGAQKAAALAQAAQVRGAAASRFQNVESEKQDIAIYQPRFMELQAGGLIGDENRLAWIETIKSIQGTRKLVSASYDIEPQQALVLGAPMALGDYQLRGSRMRVELGLVHELDLFHFIDDLRGAGRFTVQDCKLKRTDAPAESIGVARLAADCTLIWLTLGATPQPDAPALAKGSP
ncbi:hypothetical protein RBA41_26120 [Massilia sp. CCM 9210]|uniref:hypothetical protein n=1 Tax=Massilia scottii TaxID=3057166 RepID=UPI0027964B13|nr:hypothetical protein [Massilia sp. CCM 9210]MDQ1816784.1 hypothetical protein [Massilia sp. CCM 9210]